MRHTLIALLACIALDTFVSAGNPAAPPRLTVVDAERLVREHIYKTNPAMNPAAQFPLEELSGKEVFEKLHSQVFKVNAGHWQSASFLIHRGQVYELGKWFGGDGVLSLCLTELNDEPVLAYTYSWGSGIHRSHLAVCRVSGGKIQQSQPDFALRDKDMIVKSQDGKCTVFVGKTQLGTVELAQKDGKVEVDLKLAATLPDEISRKIWRP